jgi:hypothetical protein
MVISIMTFGMLLGGLYFATVYEKGDGLSTYERDAIAVVAMQNSISQKWNEIVDAFETASIGSQADHVVLYSTNQIAIRAMIYDSQAVINRWRAIDVPEEHVVSHGIGLEALRATQDGLILFVIFFQSSIDTLVADQMQSDEAAAKLATARELWERAAAVAATEG